MAEPITVQKLTNASIDADTLGEFANEDKLVVSRLGAEYPSAPMASRLLVENGLLGATPFSTYAAMTASALVDGDYAVVTNDSDINKNGVYQKINGEWELSPYNPAIQILNKILELDAGYNQVIHDSEGNKYSFAIVNELLKSIAWGMSDTKMIAPNHELDFANEPSGFTDGSGRTALSVRPDGTVQLGSLMIATSDNGAISIQDQAGRTALHITPNGKVSIFDLDAPSISSANQTPCLKLGWNRKDINHVIIYGQSLSDGSSPDINEEIAGNEISTTQPYSNLMLAGGARIEPQMTALYIPDQFAPLIEGSIGQHTDPSDTATYNGSVNESPVSSVCNEFTRRCLVSSQKATPDDFVMVGTASGRGGQSAEGLLVGTQWPVIKKHIEDVASTINALEKTGAVSAICYIQGEANHHAIIRELNSFDESITADVYEYQNRVKTLIDAIDKVIFDNYKHQDFLPHVFTYQTEAHRSYNYPDTGLSLNENPIASAQWFMTQRNPRYIIAIPVYALPKTDRDNVHLTHIGAWLMGAYIARAMEQTLHKGLRWRPLEPTHWNWTDTHCDITFYVPCGELVIDDFFCPTQPNKGFDIWINKELQTTAISSVTLFDSKTVRVNFAAPQPANAQLSYCLGREETKPNAFGNLRDTHGDSDVVTDPLGNTHNLHNPSIMFNIHKTRGFI